jgi:hypothetical protein
VIDECRVGKDLEGNYCEQIEFLPGKFLEGKEVAYITYSFFKMFFFAARFVI